MDTQNKQKLAVTGLIILVILNVALLGTIWFHHFRHPDFKPRGDRQQQRGPEEFIARELDLNDNQMASLKELRDKHMQATDSIRSEIGRLNTQLVDAFFATPPDTMLVKQLTDSIGYLHADLQLSLINHFRDLQKICTPEQQVKLKKFLSDILQRMQMPMMPPKGGPWNKHGRPFGDPHHRPPDSPPSGR